MTERPAILVTGGAGFIGSHACKALAQAGFLPVVLDNLSTGHADAVQWGPGVIADIRDRVALARVMDTYNISAVMHFAGSAYVHESMVDPAKYYDNNIGGLLALLAVLRQQDVMPPLVFSSSCATYGLKALVPIAETAAQQPINPYGRTKLVCEWMLADHAAAYGLRPAILRYFNAAGADPDGKLGERHQPETHLIPLALMAAAGLRPALDVYGADYETPDGTCVRDYIHVDDLARAHVMALSQLLQGSAGLTVNLGSGQGVSVLEVAAAVERVTGKSLALNRMPRRAGDPPILVADPSLASQLLGFRTKVSDTETIIGHAAPWFGHKVAGDAEAA
jgi:UDP-arabinose 4-epimerase